jgi:hypothetical protein
MRPLLSSCTDISPFPAAVCGSLDVQLWIQVLLSGAGRQALRRPPRTASRKRKPRAKKAKGPKGLLASDEVAKPKPKPKPKAVRTHTTYMRHAGVLCWWVCVGVSLV